MADILQTALSVAFPWIGRCWLPCGLSGLTNMKPYRIFAIASPSTQKPHYGLFFSGRKSDIMVKGPWWGFPPGSCRPQMGPILPPWNLLSGFPLLSFFCCFSRQFFRNRQKAEASVLVGKACAWMMILGQGSLKSLTQRGISSVYIHDDVIKWKHFPRLLALCAGNSSVTGEFPSQRPVTQSFDIFFDLRLNKWLSKQSWGWWFETPRCSWWRHCNVVTGRV